MIVHICFIMCSYYLLGELTGSPTYYPQNHE
jgi:hypothetical protein